ncbi:cytochrome c peroxidase [Comamonas sp. JC664]|uniref:cytochrome-c peroxidase n=1 Tax=Comamonas sp. JC664 TaxID=2801917 RepID=UPI00174E2D12|nr:cytochrome c peroxidase [Comamonas sp. JC664]MBL0697338.1 c-type cytochrome [Comamonas sp. JC664]GHG67139.1 cytochrome-c peroxidase [Comamonas sp. KCTC 72670]
MKPTAPRRLAAPLLALLLGACGEGPFDIESGPFPRHLPEGMTVIPSPEDNPLTPEGIALGRWLFHSPRLSSNGQVSCATCHEPARAFADDAALTRRGVSGRPLARHAPALINLAWMDGLFWDGGAKNLESLSLAPLTHPDEMGNTQLPLMMARLEAQPEVVERFEATFGPGSLTLSNLLRSLAQFQRTLVSADSRYDQWRRGEPGAHLAPQEQRGLALVQRHCAPCHGTELFTDNAYHNNGLDPDEAFGEDEAESRGRGRVTQRPEDAGHYKTPTLRNVAVTAPYMHDGRFATLEEVLAHYRGGMVSSTTLDAAFLQDGQPPGLPLTPEDMADVLAFLQTLTDEQFLTEERLRAPQEP